MKKTQFKDALRNIRKNFISWFAISIVIMIGCGVFFGIHFYESAMEDACRQFYRETVFEDLGIMVPGGISREEIGQFAGLDEIRDAEGCYQLSAASLVAGGQNITADIYTLTERVSVPQVTEGTLPTAGNECAIASDTMEKYGLSVGDKVELNVPQGTPPQLLKSREFTVTARIQHPLSASNNQLVLVLVPEDALETRLFGGKYTFVKTVARIDEGLNPLSDAYIQEARRVKHTAGDALAQITDAGFMMLTRENMIGYSMLRENMIILGKLSVVFVSLFFVIGAIVVFSTITIIISGQKELLGAMKAIGFRNKEIALRYVIFGVSAVCFGMILSVVQEILLQGIIFCELGAMFSIRPEHMLFKPLHFILLSVLEIVMALAVAILVTRINVLRVSAVDLMNGNTGKTKKGKARDERRGSLYARLILRNVRTDLARVIVSTVIIAGSALMIGVGFTLQGALNNMMVRSAAEITHYDLEASGSSDAQGFADFEQAIGEQDFAWAKVTRQGTFVRFGDTEDAITLISGDPEVFPDYLELKTLQGERLAVPAEGRALICNRAAEKYGIRPGDELSVYNGKSERISVTVDGIMKYCNGSVMVVSDETYRKIYQAEPGRNTILLRSRGEDPAQLLTSLREKYRELSFERTDVIPDYLSSLTRMFNVLVIIMTGLSIMMSVFVLLNLVNIFVHRRRNEIIIMGVNGFNYRQEIGYLLKETVVTTLIGILSGILLGSLMTDFLVRTIEGGFSMFVRAVNPLAWLFAFLMEGAFAFAINFVAFRRIKKLDMTDITK